MCPFVRRRWHPRTGPATLIQSTQVAESVSQRIIVGARSPTWHEPGRAAPPGPARPGRARRAQLALPADALHKQAWQPWQCCSAAAHVDGHALHAAPLQRRKVAGNEQHVHAWYLTVPDWRIPLCCKLCRWHHVILRACTQIQADTNCHLYWPPNRSHLGRDWQLAPWNPGRQRCWGSKVKSCAM